MAEKVKEVALDEADRIKTLATDAVKSAAYLYPIKVCPTHFGMKIGILG